MADVVDIDKFKASLVTGSNNLRFFEGLSIGSRIAFKDNYKIPNSSVVIFAGSWGVVQGKQTKFDPPRSNNIVKTLVLVKMDKYGGATMWIDTLKLTGALNG